MQENKIDCNSIILIEENKKVKPIYSLISVSTLKKRIEKGLF